MVDFRNQKASEKFWSDNVKTSQAFIEFLKESVQNSDNENFKENFILYKIAADIFLFANLTPNDEGEYKVTFKGEGINESDFEWEPETFDEKCKF